MSQNARRSRGRPKNEDAFATGFLERVASNGGIDKASAVPLWVQIKNAIAREIDSQGLGAHARLPSEYTIGQALDVSRPVVSAAITRLAAEGILEKVPRRGIFVAPPRTETNFLTSNVSVHSDLEARGHTVTAQAFEFRRCPPDADEARVFSLPPDGSVVRVGRVYRSDGRPITHTLISLPGHKVPEMETLDIEGLSIFQVLKDHYGLVSQRAERWFTAEAAPPEVAKRLEISENQPLIAIESIAYDPNDAPLEYYRAFYNSAVARIKVSTGTFAN
ncbi:GntR family transcriptional regulator [Jiella sonneratiae]|uniref:GntR family transcriptional regulator n=1 Tax=Jiella sonneratiae TaxID=2816856 RepID=A0ABS3J3L1_9HYPH|nr:GntR family transcriptional regulator [Jiella sonneratiae]MBO0904266.1 GntR family transcriptional regulator [Jiella sonneratiae]